MEKRNCILCGMAILSSLIGTSVAVKMSINASEIETIQIPEVNQDIDLESNESTPIIEFPNAAEQASGSQTSETVTTDSIPSDSVDDNQENNSLTPPDSSENAVELKTPDHDNQEILVSNFGKADPIESDVQPGNSQDNLDLVEEDNGLTNILGITNEGNNLTASNSENVDVSELEEHAESVTLSKISAVETTTDTTDKNEPALQSYIDGKPTRAYLEDGKFTLYYDGELYYSTEVTGNSWIPVSVSGKTIYFYAQDGALLTDTIAEINHKLYMFDFDGMMESNIWVTKADGSTYFASKDGSLAVGWCDPYGSTSKDHYFYADGKAAKGATEIDGQYYLFGDSGDLLKKAATFANDIYYASNELGHITDIKANIKDGWIQASTKLWSYKEGNSLLRNVIKKINGTLYAFNSHSIMLDNETGSIWIPSSSSYRYVSARSGGALKQSEWSFGYGSKIYLGTDGVAVSGLQTIDGNRYYFNSYGQLQTGTISELDDGEYIYSNNEGIISGSFSTKTNGWKALSNNDWIFVENNSYLANITRLIDGFYYNFQYNGLMSRNYFNYQYQDSMTPVIYYHDNTGKSRKGWVKDENGQWFYFGQDYNALRGINKINGNVYSFDSNGCMQRLITVFDNDGTVYYLKSGGQGVEQKPSAGFYMDKYYIGANGKAKTGWQKINGKWYYFNPESFYMVSGIDLDGTPRIKEIDKKHYAFGHDGAMLTGWLANKYYANPDGSLVENGWKKINGSWYYFESTIMKTGFVNDGNTLYFISSDGGHYQSVTTRNGWIHVHGDWGFLENGEFAHNTYGKSINSNIYGFDANGMMIKNQLIDDYYFDQNGYAKRNFWLETEPNIWQYFDASGKIVRNGWKSINGKKYFFENSYIRTSDAVIDNQLCRFNKSGALISNPAPLKNGWNIINGHWYFYEGGNIVKSKTKEINGKTYYFNYNGRMAAGEVVTVDGYHSAGVYRYKRCYFDVDGVMAKNKWCGPENQFYARADGSINDFPNLELYGSYSKEKINGIDYLFEVSTGSLCKKSAGLNRDKTQAFITDNSGRVIEIISAKSKNGWVQSKNGLWHFVQNGKFQTGIIESAGNLYYCNPMTGVMITNQAYSSFNGLYYADSSGKLKSHGWFNNFFISNGHISTGLTVINNKTYLFSGRDSYSRATAGLSPLKSGMITLPDGSLMFIDEKGNSNKANKNQWYKVNGNWYYQSSNPSLYSSLTKIDGTYYYLDSYGKMLTDTLCYSYAGRDILYYINSDGNLSKGWHKVDNTWYYFGDDYKAVTGQQVINGKTYYFDASGKWIK